MWGEGIWHKGKKSSNALWKYFGSHSPSLRVFSKNRLWSRALRSGGMLGKLSEPNLWRSQRRQTGQREVKQWCSSSRVLQGGALEQKVLQPFPNWGKGRPAFVPLHWPVIEFGKFFQPREVPRETERETQLWALIKLSSWENKYLGSERASRRYYKICYERGDIDIIQECPSKGADPDKELGMKQGGGWGGP